MKRLMVSAALMLLPLGCVSNQGDSSVRFLSVRALKNDDGCAAENNKFITTGSLDLSGGQNYLLAPSVETNTVSQADGTAQGLDVTLSELIYSYKTSQAGLSLPADEVDRVPIYAVFRAGTNPDESYLFLHAFGPKALKALQNSISVGQEPVTVLATIKGRGYLSSGQTVESNEFTFPVTVYKSKELVVPLPACGAGYAYAGTCGIPGQDVDAVCVKAGS